MSWIRSLVLVTGLALLVAPVSLAEGEQAPAESQPEPEAAAEAPADAAAQALAESKQSEVASEAVVEPETPEAPPATEPAASTAPADAPPATAGRVARAVFTTAVADREPSDELSVVSSSLSRVYFFTELLGLEGQRVTHRWEQGGEVRAEVQFDVGGPRWRVWSSKQILPEWAGEWRVAVLDQAGAQLATKSFSYRAPE